MEAGVRGGGEEAEGRDEELELGPFPLSVDTAEADTGEATARGCASSSWLRSGKKPPPMSADPCDVQLSSGTTGHH